MTGTSTLSSIIMRRLSAPPTLVLEGVSHAFGEGDLRREVLRDVSATVREGEIVLLTGPSGSGKTTLLTLIGALRSLQEGSIRVLGHRLEGASPSTLVEIRRHIGFVFQSHNLLDALSARENVELALETDPELSGKARRARATEMLEEVGLADHVDKSPRHLSGGQRQRVALARALAGRPGLVLADEPTASLDGETGREVMELVSRLAKDHGTSVLLVTHDDRILHVADRILHLEDGSLTSYASAVAASTSNRLASLGVSSLGREELFEHLESLSSERFAELVEDFTAEAGRVREAIRVGQSTSYRRMLDQVLDAFTYKTGQVLRAERASLFLLDRDAGELRSVYAGAEGAEEIEIRIPLGHGIAGAVAESGVARNVPDAYEDPDFASAFDVSTGFRTRSVLCVPVFDGNDEVVAVAQVLNRLDGRPFDAEDEERFEALIGPMGVVLESWREMVRSRVQR